MVQFAWRAVSLVSLIVAYLLVSRQTEWSKLQFLGAYVVAWTLQFLSWVFWAVILYPKLFSPLRHLPGPKDGSFFNGQFARISAEPTGVPMIDWANNVPNDGLIRYLGVLNQERLLPTSPKALSEILQTRSYDFEKPSSIRHSIGRILGVGVLLAEGDAHKIQRKNLMPAFSFRHIKDLYAVFWQKSREGVQAMTEQIKHDAANESPAVDVEKVGTQTAVIEVGDWASRVTLDIIGVAGLGKDFGAIKDPNSRLNQTYRSLFKPSRQAQILALIQLFLPNWLVVNLPVRRNHDVNAAARVIRDECKDLIRLKKDKLAKKELTDVDILSVALESGGFSEDNLVDQLMTFLAAGHETTASSMTWAIYMLARFPEVQRRLREEIREKLPSPDSENDVSSLDIDRLPYLNAVCNEVLRYYAPVPTTVREANKDTSVLGQKVPKGTRIMICPWSVNKDKTQWGSDALEFNPDRWIPKDESDKRAASGGAESNYAFLTFLHGPRSCIGQAFAKAEFACILASWIGRFDFELKNKEELDEKNMLIKGGVTARPAKGLYVYAKVLDGW